MRPQPWCTPIGLLAVIGPSMNDQRGSLSQTAQLLEGIDSRPEAQDLVLLSDEVHLAGNGLEHRAPRPSIVWRGQPC